MLSQKKQPRQRDIDQLKETVLNDQVDMRSSADERVDIIALDVEIDIQPMNDRVAVLATGLSQDILHHLRLYPRFLIP